MAKNTRYCVLIGINKYDDPKIQNLKGCCNDVELLKEAYDRPSVFSKTEIIVLSDNYNSPTKSNIIRTIKDVCSKTETNDMIVLHFSGHGITTFEGQLLLYSKDVVRGEEKTTSLKFSEMSNMLDKRCNAMQRFITIDACQSGSMRLAELNIEEVIEREMKQTNDKFITVCFSACSHDEVANENTYGIFTKCLAKGLISPEACNKMKHIDSESLFKYITREMKEEEQHPYFKYQGNFSFDPKTFIISSLGNFSENPTNAVVISNDSIFEQTISSVFNVYDITLLEHFTNVNACNIEDVKDAHVIFIDIRHDDGISWEDKRLFMEKVRRDILSNRIAITLVGFRDEFLDYIPAIYRTRYSHYFFLDLTRPYFLFVSDIQFFVSNARLEYDRGTFSNPLWLQNRKKYNG